MDLVLNAAEVGVEEVTTGSGGDAGAAACEVARLALKKSQPLKELRFRDGEVGHIGGPSQQIEEPPPGTIVGTRRSEGNENLGPRGAEMGPAGPSGRRGRPVRG